MMKYRCPHCGQVTEIAQREDLPTRPFCSARCQQIDLGRWLNEEFVVSDAILPTKDDDPNAEGDAGTMN